MEQGLEQGVRGVQNSCVWPNLKGLKFQLLSSWTRTRAFLYFLLPLPHAHDFILLGVGRLLLSK